MKEISEYQGTWTYRYDRFGKSGEKHYATIELALQAATNDIQNYSASPIHIRMGNRILHESDAIYDEWAKRYL